MTRSSYGPRVYKRRSAGTTSVSDESMRRRAVNEHTKGTAGKSVEVSAIRLIGQTLNAAHQVGLVEVLAHRDLTPNCRDLADGRRVESPLSGSRLRFVVADQFDNPALCLRHVKALEVLDERVERREPGHVDGIVAARPRRELFCG